MSRKSREANIRKRVAGIVKSVFNPIIDKQRVIYKPSLKELIQRKIKVRGGRHVCYVCKKPREVEFALLKHHISYFPQVCCYVHFDCHMKIHDPDKPILELIDYNEGDSRIFYKLMEKQTNVQTA